jgi:hypothetical protein
MKMILRVTAGPHAGLEHIFPEEASLSVGRSSCASFPLPADPVLSRQHFEIGINSPFCILRDCGSTNGTWMNGQRVTWERLLDGDVIFAGTSEFAVGITEIVPGDGDLPLLRCPGCGAAAPAESPQPRFCPVCLRWQSESRAESLLLRTLSPTLRSQYLCTREFTVVAPSGRRYLITRGIKGNVYELDEEDRRLRRYCIHPEGVPPGDVMMAQMLMLLTDEDSFRRIAVATDLVTSRRLNGQPTRRAPGVAVDLDESDPALTRSDAIERQIIEMRRLGSTNADIADRLGWNIRKVPRFLKRLRDSAFRT